MSDVSDPRKLGLTRNQYVFLGKDHDAMDQFERLFDRSNSDHESLATSVSVGGSSPHSLVYGSCSVIGVDSTTNPFILNLPAATGSGWIVKIINLSTLSTGLVKIVPSTGEAIGPLPANTSAYLQNVDQAGWAFAKQSIELIDCSPGQWAVGSGSWMPEPGSVDAAGSQYYLGKFRHLPFGNIASRTFLTAPPSAPAVNTYSTATQVTGLYGIPLGAKAARLNVLIGVNGVTSSGPYIEIALTDNNTSSPSGGTTAHPKLCVGLAIVGVGGNLSLTTRQTVDVPLNNLGQFYVFTTLANAAVAGTTLQFTPIGYYMGD